MPSKAKFTTKVKEQIYERDGKRCVLCGSAEILQFHHVYFGIEANRGKDRNNADQGITVCLDCHANCHSCSSGEGKRQECIQYIKDKYDTKRGFGSRKVG